MQATHLDMRMCFLQTGPPKEKPSRAGMLHQVGRRTSHTTAEKLPVPGRHYFSTNGVAEERSLELQLERRDSVNNGVIVSRQRTKLVCAIRNYHVSSLFLPSIVYGRR